MQGLGSYKNFIKLVEQIKINLNEYPLKSIYRNLKRVMDTDFDTIWVEDTPESLAIFGKYEKERGSFCGKVYNVEKETWKISQCLLGRINSKLSSITVNFTVGKWE